LKMAIYDGLNNFIAGTNEIFVVNPTDQIVTASLTSPVTLSANTVYNMGLWVDVSLWAGFTAGGEPAQSYFYQTNWPAIFVSNQQNSLRATDVIGCTLPPQAVSSSGPVPPLVSSSAVNRNTQSSSAGTSSPPIIQAPSSTSMSMSTAGSSNPPSSASSCQCSSSSSLSNAQVIGIVVGIAVAVAIFCCLLMFCCMAGPWNGKKGGSTPSSDGVSTTSAEKYMPQEDSRVEVSKAGDVEMQGTTL